MKDITYIDAADDSIVLVCVCVENICKADYLYKDVVGSWPWTNRNVYVRSEPSGLEDVYIEMSLED